MNRFAIDLFCGLGGWAEGFLAEGYDVIGFDIERHRYPSRRFAVQDESRKSMSGKDQHGNTLMNRSLEQVYGFHRAPLTGGWDCYPGQLVLQDVLTLHGSQFRDAACIVASPPCQEFSYMAMPWRRTRQIAAAFRGKCAFPDGYTGSRTVAELTALFDACFRIQREASAAAGRHIPMVVENVCGAQRWVGRAAWHFGSFYLWGDVPALMPSTLAVQKFKNNGGSWFNIGSPGQTETGRNPVHELAGQKISGYSDPRRNGGNGLKLKDADGYDRSHPDAFGSKCPRTSSRSSARKAASALIAKIPFPLAQYIARVYKPEEKRSWKQVMCSY